MSAEMKYVVVESVEAGEQLFVFPKTINHDEFAEVLSYIKHVYGSNWGRIYRKPISAGFTDGAKCYGRSESLDLDARPGDTRLMLKGGAS